MARNDERFRSRQHPRIPDVAGIDPIPVSPIAPTAIPPQPVPQAIAPQARPAAAAPQPLTAAQRQAGRQAILSPIDQARKDYLGSLTQAQQLRYKANQGPVAFRQQAEREIQQSARGIERQRRQESRAAGRQAEQAIELQKARVPENVADIRARAQQAGHIIDAASAREVAHIRASTEQRGQDLGFAEAIQIAAVTTDGKLDVAKLKEKGLDDRNAAALKGQLDQIDQKAQARIIEQAEKFGYEKVQSILDHDISVQEMKQENANAISELKAAGKIDEAKEKAIASREAELTADLDFLKDLRFDATQAGTLTQEDAPELDAPEVEEIVGSEFEAGAVPESPAISEARNVQGDVDGDGQVSPTEERYNAAKERVDSKEFMATLTPSEQLRLKNTVKELESQIIPKRA